MNITKLRITLSLSLLAAAAVMGGCKSTPQTTAFINDQFRPDDEARNVDNVFAQQRANAAREDGTLYSQHFTGGKLNSLGYQKLSAMAYGPSAGKLAIYIDLPKNEGFDAAKEDVAKALTRGGLTENEYAINAGPNLGLSTPAEPGVKALEKLHAGSGGEGDASASSAMAASGAK